MKKIFHLFIFISISITSLGQALELPFSIKIVNPQPSDYYYGPYATTADAITAVPLGVRYDGLTVKIIGDGEYWWLDADLSDSGLIPITGGGTLLTASNGLTVVGSDVQEGGTYTELETEKIFSGNALAYNGTFINSRWDDNSSSPSIHSRIEHEAGSAIIFHEVHAIDYRISDISFTKSSLTGQGLHVRNYNQNTSSDSVWIDVGAGAAGLFGSDNVNSAQSAVNVTNYVAQIGTSDPNYVNYIRTSTSGIEAKIEDVSTTIVTGALLLNNTDVTLQADATNFFKLDNVTGEATLTAVESFTATVGGGVLDLITGSNSLLMDGGNGVVPGQVILTAPSVVMNIASVAPSAGKFLGGTVAGTVEWLTPSGSGDMLLAGTQTNTGAKTFNDATLLMRNVAGTFNSRFTNTNTAARTYTLPDASGTVSFLTNAAANYEIPISNGTNLISSQLESTAFGSINFGLASTSGTSRALTTNGSSADVHLNLTAKGVGNVTMLNTTSLARLGPSEFYFTEIASDVSFIVDTNPTNVELYTLGDGITYTRLSGKAGTSSANNGTPLYFEAGQGYQTSGNGNGGDVRLSAGRARGSGTPGKVILYTRLAGSAEVQYGTSGAFTINGLVDNVLQSGTTLTLNDDLHRGKVIYCTSGSAITITVPTGLPLGFNCTIIQDGAGTVTLSPSGTTINGKSATTGQYDSVTIDYYKSSETFIGF